MNTEIPTMKPLLIAMGIILSGNAFAQQTYICTHDEAVRTIEVVYTTPGEQVPCKVQYTKSTGTKTLWNANSEIGYCESKAEAFVNKQQENGWVCTDQSDTLEEMTTEPQDIANEIVSESQDIATEVVSESQYIATEVVTESQDITSEIVTEPQNIANEVVTKSQDIENEVVTESQDIANEVITESQDIANEVITESPDIATEEATELLDITTEEVTELLDTATEELITEPQEIIKAEMAEKPQVNITK